jgi:ATP citrate (pro-S)-lyase
MEQLFSRDTQALVYNFKANAVQRMLDFDYLCRRATPSVAALIDPGSGGLHKAFFGTKEILIPIYTTTEEAAEKHPKADVFINFASFRSAYASSLKALSVKSIRSVVIIAEGVPEREARELIAASKKLKKCIIGPATVGAIQAGAFKVANAAGTIDNMLESKLNRPGSVGFVSKSGGLSNEMYHMLGLTTDGLYEGIAVGGDAFPGTTLLDHLLRFEAMPQVKMMVMLGELGGRDEYDVVEAKKAGKIKKPLVAWVTGTCARVFPTEVQFGHAGAKSGVQKEAAQAKNDALRAAGIIVPQSFEDFDKAIAKTYSDLVKKGVIKPARDVVAPAIPAEYADALRSGSIRRPTNFICTISDDRGEEVTYGGVPIGKIVEENRSLGDVISLLWFKKSLPKYGSRFIELVLVIAADHGPCVSGAHNAIVASRAGKDLVSSVASGMLTIGPRFGGAIDDAARYFKDGCDRGLSAEQFVEEMKSRNILIPGIGHRVKSLKNPDRRVELLKDYAKKNFPSTKYLDFALAVEQETTKKANNLILNVDGCIGVLFVDLLSGGDTLSKEEVQEVLDIGCLNGLFVLARTIGMIGHVLDQKRLKAPLYRHPYDDVLFLDK